MRLAVEVDTSSNNIDVGIWAEDPMKNSIGIENKVFDLDASPALGAADAASASGSPPPATCVAEAITIC